MRRLRISQIKNNLVARSPRRNHKQRRIWIGNHCIDIIGKWVGHRQCISRITKTSDTMLSKLHKEKNDSFFPRILLARMVMASGNLLKQMNCPDSMPLSDEKTVSMPRSHIARTCQTLSKFYVHYFYAAWIFPFMELNLRKEKLPNGTISKRSIIVIASQGVEANQAKHIT